MKKHVLAAAAAVLSLAAGTSASAADINFCKGGGCAEQGFTVHLLPDNGTAGSNGGANVVWGTVMDNALAKVLVSSDEAIHSTGDGLGQSWVVANDFVEGVHTGPNKTADSGGLNFLSFSLEKGTFTHLEFRVTPIDLELTGPTPAWSFTVGGIDADGEVFSQIFSGLGKNEFFNVYAAPGQRITSASFTMPTTGGGAIAKVAQIRIDGITGVPEPGAWALMIMGFGAAGAMIRRRRAVLA